MARINIFHRQQKTVEARINLGSLVAEVGRPTQHSYISLNLEFEEDAVTLFLTSLFRAEQIGAAILNAVDDAQVESDRMFEEYQG